MAIELGTGYVSLTASAKGISNSIKNELEGPLGKSGAAAGENASKQFGSKLKSGLSNVEGVGTTAGTSVARGFGTSLKSGLGNVKNSLSSLNLFDAKLLGIAAIGGAVKFAVDAASNLQEAMSKSDAVFRENAKEVQAWAKTAATSFGQSQAQALEAAGTFGNLFQAFGIGLKPAKEMSLTLVELASDLASFNNTSVDEAITALRSGLSGETEPLKRYGVALTDARLKQEALGLGLITDVKKPLDAAAKSQAAYSLIMKDTALAQGDFARTADGYANSMKTLKAVVTDSAAAIGTALLPVIGKVIKAVADGITWLDKLGLKIQEFEKSTGTGSGGSGGLAGLAADFLGVDFDFKWGKDLADVSWGDFVSGAEEAAVAADTAGQSFDRLNSAKQRGFTASQQAAAMAAQEQAAVAGMVAAKGNEQRANQNVAAAILAANDALRESINLQLSAIDSSFANTAAQNAFITANEAAAVAVDDLSTGVNEQTVATDGATQSAVLAAEAAVRLAEDNAEATGATYSAEDAQRTLIETLMDLASRATGPVAAAIGEVITKLQETGAQKPEPTLNLNDQASPKVDAAKSKLSQFAGASASARLTADTSQFDGALARAYTRLRNLGSTFTSNVGSYGLAGGARNWRGGWTMVGEEGPELVNLPRGADVFTAAQTQGMMNGGGSTALAPAQAVIVTGNTFIGSGPEVTRLLSAKIKEGMRAGVSFLGS